MKTLPLSFKLRVEQILQVLLTNTDTCTALDQWDGNETDTVLHTIALYGLLWHSNQTAKLNKKRKKKELIFCLKKGKDVFYCYFI